MTLKYNTRQSGDVTTLDLSGRLSLAEAVAFGPGSAVILGDTIRDLVKKGQKKILLNLTDITYADSSGIGQLVSAMTTTRGQGGDLKLLRPHTRVLDLLKTTRLDLIFDIHTDEATAIQAFGRGAAARA